MSQPHPPNSLEARVSVLETQQSHIEKTLDTILLTLKEMNDKIDKTRTEMNDKIDKVRTEVNDKIDKVRTEVNDKIDKARTEVNDKIDNIKPDIMSGLYRFVTASAAVGALVVAVVSCSITLGPRVLDYLPSPNQAQSSNSST